MHKCVYMYRCISIHISVTSVHASTLCMYIIYIYTYTYVYIWVLDVNPSTTLLLAEVPRMHLLHTWRLAKSRVQTLCTRLPPAPRRLCRPPSPRSSSRPPKKRVEAQFTSVEGLMASGWLWLGIDAMEGVGGEIARGFF